MRFRASGVAVILCAMLLAVGARAQEIWRIGEFDHSYDEFACARNYPSFAATFPNDITYRLGVSQPKRDWSFVHPGPADYWAGSRVHPFTIEFNLPSAPATPLRLRIALVDVQSIQANAMVVKVGDASGTFRLRNGTNEGSLYDPAKGQPQEVTAQLPAAMFHAGLNRIVLTSTGSWFLYDAISLTAEPAGGKPQVKSLTLDPTVLLKRLGGGPSAGSGRDRGLGQVVLARVEMDGPAEVPTLTVDAPGAKVSAMTALPIFGTVEQEVVVPEVKASTDVTVTATVGESSTSATLKLTPVRHWRIFMAPSAHTDIGYTDLQANVAKRHCENTDRAVALCAKFPAFAWNLETAWQADEYERARTPEQCEKLWALARAGRIGVQANYLNMLTGLCSSEELDRWLYYAASLKRKHGVPMESALISDVPTQTWGLPTTLAAAGIRYFATGINTTRAPGFTKLMSGFPYWWEGPDGSRVLSYFAPGYGQAGGPLRSFDDLRGWVIATTRNQVSFPYDALFLYGAFPDNCALDEGIAATAQQWADTYEFPKVILSPEAEYFKYMEKTYGDKLPVVRGDGGAYWEDGAASSAQETALNRRAHEMASSADALWAAVHWVGKTTAPRTKLYDLWRNILLFDEHTWGAYNSISEPDSKFVTDQWKVKASFATEAGSQSTKLATDGLARLAAMVRTTGPGDLYFNPTSWDREEVGFGRRIPAWGYAVREWPKPPEHSPPQIKSSQGKPGPASIENEYLRLTTDGKTGGIASLIDKKTGRELVDRAAPYKLNEYLYVSGGDGTNIVDLGANKPADLTIHEPRYPAAFPPDTFPGIAKELDVVCTAEKTSYLVTEYMLWDGCPRLDIRNTVTRTPSRMKEAAYFAFPFAATQPQWRLEIPNGVMRPEIDQLPGACKEWYAIQHFARLTSKEGNLAFASPDAPLVCLGDINRGRWPEKLELHNGWLFSYAMNNYWFTNYKADQGGEMTFSYSITTQAATDAEAARFGWQAAMYPQSRRIEKAQTGPLPSSGSFCRVADGSPSAVAPGGVIITAIKAPEAGSGVIVRLLSMESKPVLARLTVGLPGIRSATLCNLVEEPLGPLKMDGAVVSVPVRPLAPTTVLLR